MIKPSVAVLVTCQIGLQGSEPLSPEDFVGQAEILMDQLLVQEELDAEFTDTTLASDASDQTLTISILVMTASALDAMAKAIAVIRAALQAIGEATPGWPHASELELVMRSAMQTERILVTA